MNESSLGKKTAYISTYKKELLFPIPRKLKRDEINVPQSLPFHGIDIWNAFEISWLNAKGKPIVALGEFVFPCTSPNIVESKSFKLYLNSFNNTRFNSVEEVSALMQTDLSEASGADVNVKIITSENFKENITTVFQGICLDRLDISCDTYSVNPYFLQTENKIVTETVYSDLLKSNCLVTHQPDWGSVCIEYSGKKIPHEGLLKYIVSFRDHNEFHEQCVERIFMDIMQHCQPEKLSVYARYTRRGGLDINPFRSTSLIMPRNDRFARQ